MHRKTIYLLKEDSLTLSCDLYLLQPQSGANQFDYNQGNRRPISFL